MGIYEGSQSGVSRGQPVSTLIISYQYPENKPLSVLKRRAHPCTQRENPGSVVLWEYCGVSYHYPTHTHVHFFWTRLVVTFTLASYVHCQVWFPWLFLYNCVPDRIIELNYLNLRNTLWIFLGMSWMPMTGRAVLFPPHQRVCVVGHLLHSYVDLKLVFTYSF